MSDKYKRNTTADAWREKITNITEDINDNTSVESDPFTSVKNLAVRHNLKSVKQNERGNKVYTWNIWTVSDTVAKGAAFRATQRTLSALVFRSKADTRIVDEKTDGGPLSSKKIVEVEVDESDGSFTGEGWTSSAENAGERWRDGIKNTADSWANNIFGGNKND